MLAVCGLGIREEKDSRVDGERGKRGPLPVLLPLAREEQLRRDRDGGGSACHYILGLSKYYFLLKKKEKK
jgi:hypothetical protein